MRVPDDIILNQKALKQISNKMSIYEQASSRIKREQRIFGRQLCKKLIRKNWSPSASDFAESIGCISNIVYYLKDKNGIPIKGTSISYKDFIQEDDEFMEYLVLCNS